MLNLDEWWDVGTPLQTQCEPVDRHVDVREQENIEVREFDIAFKPRPQISFRALADFGLDSRRKGVQSPDEDNHSHRNYDQPSPHEIRTRL
jgi:hypothetical protein